MLKTLWLGVVAAVVFISLSACSAQTQRALQQTREGGAHFSTWQHMGYSLGRATPKDTTKADISAADKEKWWGEPVRVEPIL
jgi:hypothetical protein